MESYTSFIVGKAAVKGIVFFSLITTLSFHECPNSIAAFHVTATEDVIYTKHSKHGIGVKLPTGYEAYRRTLRQYQTQVNEIQRKDSSYIEGRGKSIKEKNEGYEERNRIGGKHMKKKVSTAIPATRCKPFEKVRPVIDSVVKGLERFARAAYEMNELALMRHANDRASPLSPKLEESASTSTTISQDESFVDTAISAHSGTKNEIAVLCLEGVQSNVGETCHDDPTSMVENRRHGDTDDSLDQFTKDGARLLSASFRALSNSVGLVADVLRISGDTAAGAFGSSVKILGSSFRSAAGSLDLLANVVSSEVDSSYHQSPSILTTPKRRIESIARKRKHLTSEKLFDRSLSNANDSFEGQDSTENDQEIGKRLGLVGNTRKVAGKSMRLVSSIVRGIGDSIFVAGVASESLTASTASVVEDTVRIVEDFVRSLSDAFHFEGTLNKFHVRRIGSPSNDWSTDEVTWETVDTGSSTSEADESGTYVYYGSDEEDVSTAFLVDDNGDAMLPSSTVMNLLMAGESVFATLLKVVRDRFLMEIHFAMEDTEGVPAIAPDLLGVLFLCFISSVFLLRRKEQRKIIEQDPTKGSRILSSSFVVRCRSSSIISSYQSQSNTLQKTIESESETPEYKCDISQDRSLYKLNTASNYTNRFRLLSVIQTMLFFTVRGLVLIWGLIVNRYVGLLLLHLTGWLYLCNTSQIRSFDIQRKSEVTGFRSAIESLTSSDASLTESVAWLNVIIAKLWRFPLNSSQKITKHPYFIMRTISTTAQGTFAYDGLEPYISSYVGSVLKDLWETPDEMPNELAYLSLHSFTLGSQAPIIRGIELRRAENSNNIVTMRVALDLLLSDSSLIFDIRLSSLDYALLPSTQIKISSIDVMLDLDIGLHLIPRYPFLSDVKLSLAKLPIVSVRIIPLSQDSGLRGVDLSSLPVISDWVQSSIQKSLMEYLWPHFIALDFEKYILRSNCKPDDQKANLRDSKFYSSGSSADVKRDSLPSRPSKDLRLSSSTKVEKKLKLKIPLHMSYVLKHHTDRTQRNSVESASNDALSIVKEKKSWIAGMLVAGLTVISLGDLFTRTPDEPEGSRIDKS